ncbi:zinc ribbon domain-containing protein [Oculatella sp. FACHB-28]|uniref:zinc ribbon domain-containing protein n=1 Tax=Oculatella sp. FACHB-28 TaxID=2692845 RepID=UPI00168348B4|nr:zinc ribbon domain-containing protein [Oculatella sp. FACHB-28]MBD2057119.1 zinc ribbon domain-containing protein [Oculatella sp. FACHB-28]
MIYSCELAAGQSLYLDDQGMQVVLTLTSSSPGQQQQSSSSFQGSLTAPPQVFRTAQGIVVKLVMSDGDRLIHLQGSHVSPLSHSPDLSNAEQIQVQQTASQPSAPAMKPMPPMESMQPMPPMNLNMGDMQMSMNPMQMRMRDMELKMGSAAASASAPETASQTAQTQRFCSQCGAIVDRSDRFCSSCGYQLSVKV